MKKCLGKGYDLFNQITEESNYGFMYTEKLGKINRFKRTFRFGREDNFPICCILRFALEDAWEDGKVYLFMWEEETDTIRKSRRGTNITTSKSKCSFVPCGIFHRSREKHSI